MAANVWQTKYSAPGEVTPDDMHRRMAGPLSKQMQKFDPLYTEDFVFDLLRNFSSIVPQGSIMSGLGSPKIISLSNCFLVASPVDSYAGICYTDAQLPALMKRRGGVGLSLNKLRPNGTGVNNAAGSSTGPVLFADRYSHTTREVAQDGRRGALMLSLSVKHPDAQAFTNMKANRTKVTGANISLEIEDEFMQAVNEDKVIIQQWPCDTPLTEAEKLQILIIAQEDRLNIGELIQLDSTPLRYIRAVKAKQLYDDIIRNAWENAEPGQMFMDRMWDHAPDGVYNMYKVLTTNPCGEIGMGENDACRLIALNLMTCLDWYSGTPWVGSASIDEDKLEQSFYHLQIMADAVVDLEIQHIDRILNKIMQDPEPLDIKRAEIDLWLKIRGTAEASRRTGSGYTAIGDVIAAVGFQYGSKESLEVIRIIHKVMLKGCLSASIDLAKKFGPFKGWDPALEHNSYFTMLREEVPYLWEEMQIVGRRNVSWSTVAPTGSLSILTQTTSGIEPLFMAYYTRRKKINPSEPGARIDFKDQNGDCWTEYPVLHPQFKIWLQNNEWNPADMESVKAGFEKSPWFGSQANDIDWVQRIELQGIAQRFISHSISSTVNLPETASQEDVKTIYMEAWKRGLKGVTVYREGSRTGVLVSSDTKPTNDFKRPQTLPGTLYHVTAVGRRWTVIVGLRDGVPIEIFASTTVFGTNKSFVDVIRVKKKHYRVVQGENVLIENMVEHNTGEESALAKMISGALRHGMGVEYVVKILSENEGHLVSFSKALARTLRRYVDKEAACEKCGGMVEMKEGCATCISCGDSKCS